MLKRVLPTFTAVVAALAVVGVAWAGGGDHDVAAGASTDVSTGATVETATDDGVATTGATVSSSTDATAAASASTDVSTPTTLDDSTTTSFNDDTTTSTSLAETTSTSLDDNDDRRGVPNGITTHVVPGVGTVTISVFQGNLTLVSVVTSWQIEEQRVESDRIEIEFVSGDADAEFEARVQDGGVQVRIDTD